MGITGSANILKALACSRLRGFPLFSAIAKQTFFTTLFLAWMTKLSGLLCRNTLEHSYMQFCFLCEKAVLSEFLHAVSAHVPLKGDTLA